MNQYRIHKKPLALTTSLVLIVVALIVTAAVTIGTTRASGATTIGRADLRLADGTAIGTVTFENIPGGTHTLVKAQFNVPRNAIALRTFHGFHVHANDNPANGQGCIADPKAGSSTWFVSADGHFRRSANEGHGAHAGDLTPVYIKLDGSGQAQFETDRLQAGEIFDRAVVLHAGADNLGNVPTGEAANQYTANSPDATTATVNTGNAGDRLACGLIDVKS